MLHEERHTFSANEPSRCYLPMETQDEFSFHPIIRLRIQANSGKFNLHTKRSFADFPSRVRAFLSSSERGRELPRLVLVYLRRHYERVLIAIVAQERGHRARGLQQVGAPRAAHAHARARARAERSPGLRATVQFAHFLG